MNSLRDEIESLKFQLKKKEDRVASLYGSINALVESHTTEVRAYEDVEGKLEDIIEKLRERVLHCDILDYLKVKDSNQFQFQKLW